MIFKTRFSIRHAMRIALFIAIIFISYFNPTFAGSKGEYPQFKAEIRLTNQFGKQWSYGQAKNKIIVLFFGYTLCPDFCPLTYEKLNRLKTLLGSRSDRLLPVMISLDPGRDKVGILKKYVDFYYPGSIGLTGSKKEIDRVVGDYKAQYELRQSSSAAGYLIDHSTDIYLLNSRGRLIGTFSYNTTADEMYSYIKKNMALFNRS
ncbi:MAG: SCO family protein [Spirochaetota bacterium]|nr:SCO family protein [Spirochaetota bacterium]